MTQIRKAVAGWAPTQSFSEREKRKREAKLDRNGLDGPPLFLCHGCGKIAEGSWSGKRSYPKKNRNVYVAQAIPFAPKDWTVALISGAPPVGVLSLCSEKCRDAAYPMVAQPR